MSEKEKMAEEIGIGKDATYFGYYGQLINQQNMLSDTVRTGTYHTAIMQNREEDFMGKVVLDVGAGSGILSLFAAQAGARTVYAVEASTVAHCAATLAQANSFGDVIKVLHAKLEETHLPEKVDTIVSESMGVLLLHERMIETFVLARDLYLKPGGKMYPSSSKIHLAPFTDSSLFMETMNKVRFWQQENFYSLDISCLIREALHQHFSQPVVGCFDPRSLLSPSVEKHIDFLTVSLEELRSFEIDLDFTAQYTGVIHGFFPLFVAQKSNQEKEKKVETLSLLCFLQNNKINKINKKQAQEEITT